MTDQQIAKWIDQLQGELDVLKRTAGGGSTVTITPTLQSGEKLADFSIDGEEGTIYAPPIMDIYSTTERVAGVWIDGKPLYQKTINIGHNFPIDYDITSLGIDNVAACWGTVLGDKALPAVALNDDYSVTLIAFPTTIQARVGQSLTITTDIYATIQYTKTTDTTNNRRKK